MEIKTQAIKIHQRTCLADARVDDLLKGRLQEMGSRVIGLRTTTAGLIHSTMNNIAYRQFTTFDTTAMNENTAIAADSFNRDDQPLAILALTCQHSLIANLATTLSIEGSRIKHNLHHVTSNGAS
ncbi:MAG: Uncharacterised protein [Prochlorococcus marinus str. MIT 9215]|nr:MAG: Uncharacterised protein [Prochlorococcus marinus str. MIT 9215]